MHFVTRFAVAVAGFIIGGLAWGMVNLVSDAPSAYYEKGFWVIGAAAVLWVLLPVFLGPPRPVGAAPGASAAVPWIFGLLALATAAVLSLIYA
jgi:hypothetical protein